MRIRRRVWVVALVLALAASLIIGVLRLNGDAATSSTELDLAAVLGDQADTAGYARAEQVRAFQFPRDHGAHPAYRTEWWYFTGNLYTPAHRRFGYELTLFRIALRPESPPHASQWSTNQVYMGHFAITDVSGRKFYFFERFVRNAVGLAGAEAHPFRVWAENWSVQADRAHPNQWRLQARSDGNRDPLELALELNPVKPIVLQGDRGLSRKSATPGNASYYYSLPRIATRGTLTIGEQRFAVTGESWMDREWSTSALSLEQAGWDWFALQLSNGYELMFYRMRRKDGSVDPYSAGTLIDPHGRTTRLRSEDMTIETLDTWRSRHGGIYPARWRMTVKPLQLSLDIRPVLADQELDVSVRYWEGAVDLDGSLAGNPITGHGYAELTGYGAGQQLYR
jgi:predicted secreted hydrolase